MDIQDLLDVLNEADKAIERHYAETLKQCEETGFPTYWIAKPKTTIFAKPATFSHNPFECVRNHKKGHGWKANHKS